MAERNPQERVFNANDSLDINELASLNDDISAEFIEQLQNQVAQNASQFTGKSATDDTTLFEEVNQQEETAPAKESEAIPKPVENKTPKLNIDDNIDDNFIKKNKAKLNKQKNLETAQPQEANKKSPPEMPPAGDIEKLTGGNIIEKPIIQAQINYNDSLDYLDENVKYSKYVIYIDPENTEFIESLTVKERKNLINKILREQDDIALTKKRFNMVQALIKHSIIAIITIAIAIPIIYITINASLEASINNYRRSQTIFKTLYREKGKIKNNIY